MVNEGFCIFMVYEYYYVKINIGFILVRLVIELKVGIFFKYLINIFLFVRILLCGYFLSRKREK